MQECQELNSLYLAHINQPEAIILKLYEKVDTVTDMIQKMIDLDTELKMVTETPIKSKVVIGDSEIKELFKSCDKSVTKNEDKTSELRLLFNYFAIIRILVYSVLEKDSKVKIKATDEIDHYKRKDKDYIVYITENESRQNIATIFFLVFYIESYFNKNPRGKDMMAHHSYVGIDFEFNRREVALMQLNFEGRHRGHLLITSPNNFSEKTMGIYIKYIMENRFILKILHGSDSLDVPYIYNKMFNANQELIIKFTKSMVDTRFLCEYLKVIEKKENVCTIYNALLDFGVISKTKYDDLELIQEKMQPIQDVTWTYNHLSDGQVQYAYCDVLYLKYLYKRIYKTGMKIDQTKGLTYIPTATQFIYLSRRDIIDVVPKCKKEVDPINNYMIYKSDGTNVTIITIFNEIMKDNTEDYMQIILGITSINYFRTQLNMIFKKTIFTIISELFTIYKDKKTTFDDEMVMDWVYDDFNKLKMTTMVDLIKRFYNGSKKKIINNYS